MPDQIVEKKHGSAWDRHLYCDKEGKFYTSLTSWESELLTAEMAKSGFVCWLRNLDRREWAFCVPYEMGGIKAFYPDFAIVRKSYKGLIVDILEPHDDSRVDTVPKTIGLAMFAEEHGKGFGRIIVARKKGDKWQMVDINKNMTRVKVLKMQPSTDLEDLFA